MSKAPGGPSVARGFVLGLLLLAISGGQALAHRSPSDCNANRLTLSLDQNPAGNIVSGQTVTYTVGVFNPGPGTGIGCDVTGTTVTFTCPGPDGSPSGQTTVLGTGLSFPADNSGDTIFPSVSCKIVVTSGVTSATARAQAGQNTGNRAADLTKGVLHDSAIDDPFVRINDLSLTVNTCVAKVDKQVSCDGGKTFHDVGLVTADEDGHTDVCFGWTAFTINGTAMPAEPIQVRYAVANAGTADLLTCSITESNDHFATTVSVGSLAGVCVADIDCGNAQATCVNGACVFTSSADSSDCSASNSAAEPDTATVTCEIKDSVDPANPSQPKKTPPATDQDVCPVVPPPPMCPKAFTGGPCSLGLADNFAILGLKGANLIISEGATKIIGDVGAGPMDTGTLLKSTVQGNLFIDPTATLDIHSDFKVTGNVTSKDLSPEVADALAASACAANLPTTQSLGNITTETTITGNGGLNVIAVESVDIVKQTLTISGGPNDIFIFNVAGDFIFNGSQMVLSGGVMANHILWNFPTAGSDILFFKPVAVANGTFLAPLRSYIQDHGQLNGAVIAGGTIKTHSAAFVNFCPMTGD